MYSKWWRWAYRPAIRCQRHAHHFKTRTLSHTRTTYSINKQLQHTSDTTAMTTSWAKEKKSVLCAIDVVVSVVVVVAKWFCCFIVIIYCFFFLLLLFGIHLLFGEGNLSGFGQNKDCIPWSNGWRDHPAKFRLKTPIRMMMIKDISVQWIQRTCSLTVTCELQTEPVQHGHVTTIPGQKSSL